MEGITQDGLIAPYGGRLADRRVPPEECDEVRAYAARLPAIQLSERAVCDLELLATGAFSPLARFMEQADYRRVLAEMRLADGTLFPIPVTLPVEPSPALRLDQDVALRDVRNDLLAVLTVEEIYAWDVDEAAQAVFGTRDPSHPLVAEMQGWGPVNISGRLRVMQLPRRYDFASLRLTPAQTRARLAALGRPNVVAFQTRNPLHRAHEELTKRAIEAVDGTLLLHPAVGLTKPGDVDHFTRVGTYQALTEQYYPPDRVLLALLPLAMRLAGPREAVWHALIRRNYGANYFIVGRDHAGPGADAAGRPFYDPTAAQALATHHQAELGVGILPFREFVYLPDEDRYEEAAALPPETRTATISGTAVRTEYLNAGRPLPAWFTRPAVAAILAEAYPPRHRQGVCVWFTGLPAAGKSTLAEVLAALVQEHGRAATVLDSDALRTHLSRGLGFSKEDRDAHIRRVGFVAAAIVRHGGLAICATISPYRAVRAEVRAMIGPEQFIEVFVDTPLAVCEQRDPKGLYARARRGELSQFTGIDDPYEPPLAPDLTLHTEDQDPADTGRTILDYLIKRGFVRPALF